MLIKILPPDGVIDGVRRERLPFKAVLIRGDLLAQIDGQVGRCRRLGHVHDLKTQILVVVGSRIRRPEQFHENPPRGVIRPDLVFRGVKPQGPVFLQQIARLQHVIRAHIRGRHRLRKLRIEHHMNRLDRAIGHVDRIAGVDEIPLRPIHLMRWLHRRTGDDIRGGIKRIDQPGIGIEAGIRPARIHVIVRVHAAGQRGGGDPRHLHLARLRGKDHPGIRTVIIRRGDKIVGRPWHPLPITRAVRQQLAGHIRQGRRNHTAKPVLGRHCLKCPAQLGALQNQYHHAIALPHRQLHRLRHLR